METSPHPTDCEKPGIEPVIPGLQGEWLIYNITMAPRTDGIFQHEDVIKAVNVLFLHKEIIIFISPGFTDRPGSGVRVNLLVFTVE